MKYPLHTHYSQKDKRPKWGGHGSFHFKQRVKSQENLKNIKILEAIFVIRLINKTSPICFWVDWLYCCLSSSEIEMKMKKKIFFKLPCMKLIH